MEKSFGSEIHLLNIILMVIALLETSPVENPDFFSLIITTLTLQSIQIVYMIILFLSYRLHPKVAISKKKMQMYTGISMIISSLSLFFFVRIKVINQLSGQQSCEVLANLILAIIHLNALSQQGAQISIGLQSLTKSYFYLITIWIVAETGYNGNYFKMLLPHALTIVAFLLNITIKQNAAHFFQYFSNSQSKTQTFGDLREFSAPDQMEIQDQVNDKRQKSSSIIRGSQDGEQNQDFQAKLMELMIEKIEIGVCAFNQRGEMVVSNQVIEILLKCQKEEIIETIYKGVKSVEKPNLQTTMQKNSRYLESLIKYCGQDQIENHDYNREISFNLNSENQRQFEVSPHNNQFRIKSQQYRLQTLICLLKSIESSRYLQHDSEQSLNKLGQNSHHHRKHPNYQLDPQQRAIQPKGNSDKIEFTIENQYFSLEILTFDQYQEEDYLVILIQTQNWKKSQKQLVNTLAHQLQTPLNCCLGLLQVMKTLYISEQIKDKYLRPALSSSYYLLNNLNMILDIEKIQINEFNYEIQQFSVRKLILEVFSIIRNECNLKNIQITCNIDKKLDKFYSDPKRVKQVMINILNNAIQYSFNNSTIQIQVSLDFQHQLSEPQMSLGINYPEEQKSERAKSNEGERSRQFIEFQIIDYGVGMNEAQLKNILIYENGRGDIGISDSSSRVSCCGIQSVIQILEGLSPEKYRQCPVKITSSLGVGCTVQFKLSNFASLFLSESVKSENSSGKYRKFNINQKAVLVDQQSANNLQQIGGVDFMSIEHEAEQCHSEKGQFQFKNFTLNSQNLAREDARSGSGPSSNPAQREMLRGSPENLSHDQETDLSLLPRKPHENNESILKLFSIRKIDRSDLINRMKGAEVDLVNQQLQQQQQKESKLEQDQSFGVVCQDFFEFKSMSIHNKILSDQTNDDFSQILIVDDNAFNVLTLEYILEELNLNHIDKAFNGQQAIDKFIECYQRNRGSQSYDLIFMDIDMPVKNGYTASEEILYFCKNHTVQTSIVACTAFIGSDDIRRASQIGINDYIIQPVNIKLISDVLNKYMIKV